jgi:ABC-type bacteriocin/lantibiotic exporter with double-glycine peptidase domain
MPVDIEELCGLEFHQLTQDEESVEQLELQLICHWRGRHWVSQSKIGGHLKWQGRPLPQLQPASMRLFGKDG